MNQDRRDVLLMATYELLKKCNHPLHVKDALSETVFYDDAECDGYCLATDIAIFYDIDEKDFDQ